MRIPVFHTFFAIFLFVASLPAQSDPPAQHDKEKDLSTLIDQVSAEIPSFRQAENRTIVLAKVGALQCKFDKDRSRSNFQTAIAELLNAQYVAETNKIRFEQQSELLTGQGIRQQVLTYIAVCDADFALENLYKTRPAAVIKALAVVGEKGKRTSGNATNTDGLARSELQLEQNLIRLAARQSPTRAVQLLKESLKKGITGQTLSLLHDLFEKDPQAAAEIAPDVISSLKSSDLIVNGQPDAQILNVSASLLSEHIREHQPSEKYLKFDDSQMRSLAVKLITFLIEHPQWQGYLPVNTAISISEKLAPSMTAALRQLAASNSNGFNVRPIDSNLTKLLTSNPPASTLISEAKNFPVESRRQIYQTAANKMADEGNYDGAAALLNENISSDELANAINSLNWYYAHLLINKGRYDEAEHLIEQFPDNNRNAALINLAQIMFTTDKEKNKPFALSILNRVREQMVLQPANAFDLSHLMQLIAVYLTIEPSEAFDLMEPLIPRLNEVSEAAVVLYGFQGGGAIKDGEFPIMQSQSMGFYLDSSIFQRLLEKDFDRTTKLIDAFSRRELRVAVKLGLAETLATSKQPAKQ